MIVGAMTVKNEMGLNLISKSIFSLINSVDKIIVCDTGSTDGTNNFLKNIPEVVLLKHPWPGSYAKAKNLPLDYIKKNFSKDTIIVSLDGDEIICGNLRGKLKKSGSFDGLKLTKYNLIGPMIFTNQLTKIFKNSKSYQYSGKVFETIDNSIIDSGGKINESDIFICDFGRCRETVDFRKKYNYYKKLLLQEMRINISREKKIEFLQYKAYVETVLGEYENAILSLKEALDMEKQPSIYLFLGHVYRQIKKFSLSRRVLKILLNLSNDNQVKLSCYNQLAYLEFINKNLEQALEYLKTGSTLINKSVIININIAYVNFILKRYRKSKKHLEFLNHQYNFLSGNLVKRRSKNEEYFQCLAETFPDFEGINYYMKKIQGIPI
ncbi:glycosyltransferase [Candidatus Woesearchaeota archaeon]|nr:glycosyltransferase [Candidatus Woesearchaeota archaeon]